MHRDPEGNLKVRQNRKRNYIKNTGLSLGLDLDQKAKIYKLKTR